ncbi:ATP-binding cassette domain-containing protein [Novosphingobium tardum]|uniref:ATP-binding cassette domain-containing protein n=1 Tax=Novosphingobium tardum TaxID=1538021 RepID=A0ABV8RQC3_9SPHN
MKPTGPEIRFVGLGRRFGETVAVEPLDLTIAGGSFVALVGASGSGKSTLLRSINRLDEAAGAIRSGSVSIGGIAVDDIPASELRRGIGYVFQSVGLFPHMTVGENIAIGRRIRGERMPENEIAGQLELVDLPADFAKRMPDALSGGQQQRVGVARALAERPQVLLLDEPFGALDPITRDALARRVRAIHDRLGLTTILVTHDMAEALLLADRVLVMDHGRIVADAAPRELAAGRAGPAAEALVAVPRNQARRLADLAR